jgi:hypothetical protein
MSSRYRKYDSGADKRKKRQRLDAVACKILGVDFHPGCT